MDGALIAALVALVVFYLNNFVAEEFKRFREGSVLAAGLAGELASYRDAYPILRNFCEKAPGMINGGDREKMNLRAIEMPKDRVFDSAVGKLGMLGSELAEDLAYVYNNINAFRQGLTMVFAAHEDMGDDELALRISAAGWALDRASTRGELLVPKLIERSQKRITVFGVAIDPRF